LYSEPEEYDENIIKKRWKEDTPELLNNLRNNIAKLENPDKEDFENALTKTAEELNIGKGKLIHPVRLALSGIGTGPGIYDLLYILGKDKSMERIDRALKVIKIPNTNGSE
jgi:glutamyl-tRNA synthetase